MIILLCGLSGAGKTTLSGLVSTRLKEQGEKTEIIDGDVCRKYLFKELGFSKEDRFENMRRMAYLADKLARNGILAIISAVNPFETIRKEIKRNYADVRIVHIDCNLSELQQRDTKGLYRRSRLPEGHPDKVYQLTGVSQEFDVPIRPDLRIDTSQFCLDECVDQLYQFIKDCIYQIVAYEKK